MLIYESGGNVLMSKDNSGRGPQISDSQQIGSDAEAALYANKPLQWSLARLNGDDFGVDYQGTAFGAGSVGGVFYFNVQLKGTTQQKARVDEGRFLSHAFDRSTLTIWHRSGTIILVVIADLIESRDPKHANVYFLFANPELDRVLNTLPPEQSTVTLRVPTSQIVHRALDVIPEITEYLEDIRQARELVRARKRTLVGLQEEVAAIAPTANTNVNVSVNFEVGGIEVVIESMVNGEELRAALRALRSGDYERVLKVVTPPTKEAIVSEPERSAVSAYLRARAFEAIGNTDDCAAMIAVADSILPMNDDIAATAAEHALSSIDPGPKGIEERKRLFSRLPSTSGVGVAIVKAKLLALEGSFDAARALLALYPRHKTSVALAVVSAVEGSWATVLEATRAASDAVTTSERQLLSLQMLEARAYFQLALENVDQPPDTDLVVPPTGLPGIDYEQARQAYQSSLQAMLASQRLNWPIDTYYVLDVFTITATVLGLGAEALPLLSEFALTRPTATEVREVVAKVAVQLDRPEIAVQLSQLSIGSPRFANEDAVMAVAAYKSGDLSKALSFITDQFLADPSDSDVYLSSLLVLGIAAASELRADLLERIRTRLDRSEASREFGVILDSAAEVQRSILRRPDAIQKLYRFWKEHPSSHVVGFHLLLNADATDGKEAAIILEIATEVEISRSLGAEHLAQVGQALLTLHRFDEAVTRLRKAGERFANDPELKTLLGVALEMHGHSAEAFRLFEDVLTNDVVSETARRYYVNIAIRTGFFDRAEAQVRAAYSKAKKRQARLQLLNILFQLLLAAGDRPDQVEDVAWEYGRLCDQSIEKEEGIFLQEYYIATMSDKARLRDERVSEFQLRLQRFIVTFPKSKYLMAVEQPSAGPPEDLARALQSAIGITEEVIEKGRLIERQMNRGSLHVPFSWRPRTYLRNIADVFMLWQVRKQIASNHVEFHFVNSVPGYERQTPRDLRSLEPLLSLTSLLVLDEVGMLETVLDSFSTVLVARATVALLQEARTSFVVGGWGKEAATRITKVLQARFDKIYHPSYSPRKARPGVPHWHAEEEAALSQDGRMYFNDDIIETVFVCNPEKSGRAIPSLTTAEFVTWADQEAQLLTARQAADVLGRMVRLKIGAITIEPRYLIAAIPESLQFSSTDRAADIAFGEAITLQSLLDGLWDSSKPFGELKGHFARTLSYLINDGNASEPVLVHLWLRWLQAVRLQAKPNLTPLRKLAVGFVATLNLLDDSKASSVHLWQSFWQAVKRGLASTLMEPEDLIGIKTIGASLGTLMSKDGASLTSGRLFQRALLGLEAGTARYQLFNDSYVEGAATAVQRQLQTQQRDDEAIN